MAGFLALSSFICAKVVRYDYKGTEITLGFGNIEAQQFDPEVQSAIVNAANSKLLGGGGVDGAIHKAAGGHRLKNGVAVHGAPCQVCTSLRNKYYKWAGTTTPHCPTGHAVTTSAGNLMPQVKYIIHTVGPNCTIPDQNKKRKALLTKAYTKSLQEVAGNYITHVALPQISVGSYKYPLEEAVSVALKAITDFIDKHIGELEQIRLVMYNDTIGRQGYNAYKKQLNNLSN